MQLTDKGKKVTLNKTEQAPLVKARELLGSLAILPFPAQDAAGVAFAKIGDVLTATEKPAPAETDSGKEPSSK